MSTDPSTEAYAAVEKAAASDRTLYAPSILKEAASVLDDMWATGERRGIPRDEWGWAISLPDGVLSVTARTHTSGPTPERTAQEVHALQRALLAALNSGEDGLTARLGPRASVLVNRLPQTPRGGLHGDADLMVGIYSNGGWDISMNANGATVVPIAAPATTTGAAEVAAVVRAVARGELGNPFRR